MPLAGLASFQQSADLQPVYSEQRSACQGPAGLVASPSDNREVTAPGWLRYWRTGTWVVRTHHPVVIRRKMYMRDTVFFYVRLLDDGPPAMVSSCRDACHTRLKQVREAGVVVEVSPRGPSR